MCFIHNLIIFMQELKTQNHDSFQKKQKKLRSNFKGLYALINDSDAELQI